MKNKLEDSLLVMHEAHIRFHNSYLCIENYTNPFQTDDNLKKSLFDSLRRIFIIDCVSFLDEYENVYLSFDYKEIKEVEKINQDFVQHLKSFYEIRSVRNKLYAHPIRGSKKENKKISYEIKNLKYYTLNYIHCYFIYLTMKNIVSTIKFFHSKIEFQKKTVKNNEKKSIKNHLDSFNNLIQKSTNKKIAFEKVNEEEMVKHFIELGYPINKN